MAKKIYRRQSRLECEQLPANHPAARHACETLEARTLLTGLIITPTFAANITSDPNAATIEATINSAIGVYEAWISTPITVAITFQEQSTGLGNSNKPLYNSITYASVRSALAARAITPDALAAVASLPVQTNDPLINNADVQISQANARALGFNVVTGGDGLISLNTGICNLSRAFTDPTKEDLQSVTEHEIDEVLGFGSALDGSTNGGPTPAGPVTIDDLFRYAPNGARSFTTSLSAQAYYSVDGGFTDLARFNQIQGGDFGDWFSPSTVPPPNPNPQVQDAFSTYGATPDPGVELRRLNAMGYQLNFAALIGSQLQVSDYWGLGSTIIISQSGPNIVVQDNGVQELFPIASISSIVVHGNDGDDIIRMEGNAGITTTLNGDAGNDFFDFSFSAQNLSNISGFTNVSGGAGADNIFVYDNNFASPATYFVNPIVSRNGFGGVSYGSDVEGITLTTGTQADTVNVTATSAGTPLFLNSAGGNDTVNVEGNNGLTQIAADVQVQNSSFFTALNINDTGDVTARNITVDTSSGFGYVASVSPYPASVFWKISEVNVVNLTSGGLADTVNINNNADPLSFDSAGGQDIVNVGNNTNGMQGITANVSLLNNPSSNIITLNDLHDSVARTITQSSITIGVVPYGLVSGLAASGATVQYKYNDTSSVTIDAASVGGNIVNILAVSRTLNVVSASPLMGPHDAINIGNSSSLAGILDPVNVSNSSGYDDITMNDSSNAQGQSYTLSTFTGAASDLWGRVDIAIPGEVNFKELGTAALSLNMALGGTANVQDTGTFTSINQSAFGHFTANVYGTTAPLTLFHFGSGAAGMVVDLGLGNTQAIHGAVTIQDTNIDHSAVTIDNSSDMATHTGTIAATSESGITPATVTYPTNNTLIVYTGNGGSTATVSSTPSVFQLIGGSGNDLFNITGTTAGTTPSVSTLGGNDTINIGGGTLPSIGAFLTVDGGLGVDTVALNDQSETIGLGYTIAPTTVTSQFFFAGVNYSNAESLIFNTGSHNNSISITGTNSGTPVTVNGSTGGNAYSIGNPTTTLGIFSLVTINGGGGVNNLVLDDSTDVASRTFHLNGNLLGATAGDTLFGLGGSVAYSSMSSLTVNGDAAGNAITINNTVAATPVTLNTGTGNDTVNVLRTGGAVAINGQSGTDSVNIGNAGNTQAILDDLTVGNVGGATALTVDDSADSIGQVVTIDASSIAESGRGTIHLIETGGSSVNPLTVNTGLGADTVNMPAVFAGVTLNLSTGAGDDIVNVGAGPNQLAGLFNTGITLNGGTGANLLNFYDQADSLATHWTVTAALVTDSTSGGAVTLTDSGFASISVNAGAIGSTFRVSSTVATTSVVLNEGAGDDSNSFGISPFDFPAPIASHVTVNGNGGNNTLTLADVSTTVPATVHVTPTQIGSTPGDNILTTGGSITYTGVSSITLSTPRVATGNTIFAQPSSTTAYTIFGGNSLPATSTLTIVPQGAANPINTPTGTGAGQYTFSNRQPITYSFIKSVVLDNVPPTVTNAVFNYNSSQALVLTFSEDVSSSLSATPITLLNQTVNASPSYIMGAYDHVGNTLTFTFPAILQDGNYHVTLPAGSITDPAGNPLAADFTYDFFVLAGDANRDRHVDATDQAILNSHLGQSGNFSAGDFSYNGTVDAADTTILNNNFNLWLPPQGPLVLLGTSADDTYVLRIESIALPLIDVNYISSVSGSQTYRIPMGAVSLLSLSGGNGNDALTLDFANGSPLPAAGMSFDGGSGVNSLTLIGATGNHSIQVQSIPILSSQYAANYDAFGISFSNVQNVTVNPAAGVDSLTTIGAAISLPQPSTTKSITPFTLSSLNLALDDLLTAPSLFNAAGSLDHTHRTLLDVASLYIDDGTVDLAPSMLNLAGNDMILRNGGTAGLAYVDNLIKIGFNAGAGYWNGIGINSSTAAASNNTALGVELNDAGGGATLVNTFDGQAVTPTDVLVKYTYYGDANLDGKVDATDYALIDNGFNTQSGASQLSGWRNGDFNYDGSINGDDYTLIDNAFNTQGSVSLAVLPTNEVANNTAKIASTFPVSSDAVPGTAGVRQFAATVASPLTNGNTGAQELKKRHASAWELLESGLS